MDGSEEISVNLNDLNIHLNNILSKNQRLNVKLDTGAKLTDEEIKTIANSIIVKVEKPGWIASKLGERQTVTIKEKSGILNKIAKAWRWIWKTQTRKSTSFNDAMTRVRSEISKAGNASQNEKLVRILNLVIDHVNTAGKETAISRIKGPPEKVNVIEEHPATNIAKKAISGTFVDLSTQLSSACSRNDLNAVIELLQSEKNIRLDIQTQYKTPIDVALEKNNEAILAELTSNDHTNDLGENLLHRACKTKDVEFVRKFIMAAERAGTLNELLEAQDKNGNISLHTAIIYGTPEIVELLLVVGNNYGINKKNKEDKTPLDLACELGNTNVVKELLVRGANINMESALNEGYSNEISDLLKEYQTKRIEEFSAAISRDDLNAVQELSQSNIQSTIYKIPIDSALVRNKSALAELTSDENRNSLGENLLHMACRTKKIEFVKQFIKAAEKADTLSELLEAQDNNGNIPLHTASSFSTPEIIELLLNVSNEYGINKKNKAGKTPLDLACENCNVPIAKILLDRGATIDLKVVTSLPLEIRHKMLIEAYEIGYLNVVSMLLDLNIGVVTKYADHQSLLYLALSKEPVDNDLVCLLIDSESNINSRSYFFENDLTITERPIHTALSIKHPNIDIVEALINADADLNTMATSKDKDGNIIDSLSPLHIALLYKPDINIIKLLLKNHADANAIGLDDGRQTTPLHIVCMSELAISEKKKLIDLLIKYGANIDEQYADGKSLLQTALSEDLDKEIIQYHIEKMTSVNVISEYKTDQNLSVTEMPLHAAIDSSDIALVTSIVNAGANVNSMTTLMNEDIVINSLSPLHLALLSEPSIDIVKLLLKKGAHTSIYGIYNGKPITPLQMVITNKELSISEKIELIRLLVQYGADLTEKNKETGLTQLEEILNNPDLKELANDF